MKIIQKNLVLKPIINMKNINIQKLLENLKKTKDTKKILKVLLIQDI